MSRFICVLIVLWGIQASASPPIARRNPMVRRPTNALAVPPSKLPPIQPLPDSIPEKGSSTSRPIRPQEAFVELRISLKAHKGTESNHDEPYAVVNGKKFPEVVEHWEFGDDYTNNQDLGHYDVSKNAKATYTIDVMEKDDNTFTGDNDHLGRINVTVINEGGAIKCTFSAGENATKTSETTKSAAFTLTGSGANYAAHVDVEVLNKNAISTFLKYGRKIGVK